jgi:hypothetical protein
MKIDASQLTTTLFCFWAKRKARGCGLGVTLNISGIQGLV